MKKSFWCIVFMALFVACSQTEQQKELKFLETMTSPSRTAVIQSMIDEYQLQNPGVAIELISPPYEQADNKLTLMLNSKQPLDVVEVRDHTLKQFVNNQNLTDLTPFIDSWDDADDLLPRAQAAARTVNDTPYLIPEFFAVKALFVRTDILSRLGYEVPQKMSMAELYRIATEITSPEDNQYGFGFRGKGSSFKISDSMILSDIPDINPANIYTTKDGRSVFQLPETKEALQAYVELVSKMPCPQMGSTGALTNR